MTAPTYRVDLATLAATRWRYVTEFLAARGLSPVDLRTVMTERLGPARHLLLSSSAVHGLANPSSDVDFLRVVDEVVDGPRISTKIFHDGRHLEATTFAYDEVSVVLVDIERLATAGPAEIVAALSTWDATREPRRKQTERIINGVTLDGEMPYARWLGPLGVTWSVASLRLAAEQAAYLHLAEAAGEPRGRLGYAVNSVIHLADAVLQHHGSVISSKKWVMLRWTRLADVLDPADPVVARLVACVDDLRRLTNSQRPGQPARPIAPHFAEAVARVAQVITPGYELTARARWDPGAHVTDLLTGAGVLQWNGRAQLVSPAEPLTHHGPVPLAALGGLSAERSRLLLQGARSGACTVGIEFAGAST